MKPFTYIKPESLGKALTVKKSSTQYIAGGTNLVDLMKKQITQPDAVEDISQLLSDDIKLESKGILIGAMAKNSAVAVNKNILTNFPLVSKALLAGASPQIRNMASIGGNLLQRTRCPYFYDVTLNCNKRTPGTGCSAIKGENRMSAIVGYSNHCVAVHPSDLCVALAALDASVSIINKNQKKEVIAFKSFHRLPDEHPEKDNHLPEDALIASVQIPNNPFSKNYAYIKLRDRDSYAFALVSVAAALHLNKNIIQEARLASGGVAHKPWRWTEAESFLKGKSATVENFVKAADIIATGLKPLSGNGFKVQLLKGAVETALQKCLTP